MSLLADWVAARRERRLREARDATVKAVLARNAAADEAPTLQDILARAEATDTAYPRVPSRHLFVGSGRKGEPWAVLGR
jgi:hypothetical protein